MLTLPPRYDGLYAHMLAEVAFAASDLDMPLAQFWPYRGAAHDGGLFVIGRSVNGWVSDWTAGQLRQPQGRMAAVDYLRGDAELVEGCRMRWVTDRWGTRDG